MKFLRDTHTCRLCGSPVSLETSKTDENGQAVHETCYVNQLLFRDEFPAERGCQKFGLLDRSLDLHSVAATC